MKLGDIGAIAFTCGLVFAVGKYGCGCDSPAEHAGAFSRCGADVIKCTKEGVEDTKHSVDQKIDDTKSWYEQKKEDSKKWLDDLFSD